MSTSLNCRLLSYLPRLLSGCALAALVSACDYDSAAEEETLFTQLSAETTGIDFTNLVEDQADFNILTYRNFYNGGGVAIGDINNDSLPDIYFTANLQPNKLYLNKGNWKFEDISTLANVGGSKAWSTGVTMVDINHDGLLDIYVCNSGDVRGDNKENELFINNGDLTFTEAAEDWGLDNQGYSTHASFFDYDQDGDLDCYLLNNSFKSPDRIELYRKSREDIDFEGGDKLFRNDGDIFTDATAEAGIFSSDVGFGLGVSVSDINNDMLPDIYVSNDFWERDYLYINRGDGTFSEELESRISMTSMNSMGADIGDLNNDGYPEIITTDMLPADNFRLKTMTQFEPYRVSVNKTKAGYYHQVMQNCLQLNNGLGQFQEVAFMAGVGSTDWSWGALMLDFDLDGLKDIFVSNGIQRDLTDMDFVDFISDRNRVSQAMENFEETGYTQTLDHMPSTKLANYAFINQGGTQFVDQAKELGLATPSFSNGSAYGDLDNDGDLDLVVNNANMPCFVYRNNAVQKSKKGFLKIELVGPSKNPNGIGAKVIIKSDQRQQTAQHCLSRGFQSSVEPGLWFGLGKTAKIDTLEVIWPDKKKEIITNVQSNSTLELNYAQATTNSPLLKETVRPLHSETSALVFDSIPIHRENEFDDFDIEILLHRKLSEEGPQLVEGDVNDDGLVDFLILGAANQTNRLYVQQSNNTFQYSHQPEFVSDQKLESTCASFFDADGDSDLDLLVGHGGNEGQKGIENFYFRYYDNDGAGNFTPNVAKTPPGGGNVSVIKPNDFDKDGDVDLFIGGRAVPGHYGLIPRSFLLQNQGDGTWVDITTQTIGQLGMVTAATWADIDSDQDMDLLVVGEWMPVTILENTGNSFTKKIVEGSNGWWSALEKADLDGDGDLDFVLGNWGTNSKFRASHEKPLTLYTSDYDNNGKVESILEWYPPHSSTAYPFATKADITSQLPFLKKKVLKYEDYAKSTFSALFTNGEKESISSLEVTYLESAILWNDLTSYRLEALPQEAQVAPVYSIVADCLDDDDYVDLLLMGNMYSLKPEVGRLDANRGVLLKGLGVKGFLPLTTQNSGFWLKGQVRDAMVIPLPEGRKRIIVARNNLPVSVYDKIVFSSL